MSKLKGLITKDLLQLKSYRKTLIMFIVVFIIVSLLDKSANSIETTIILMMTLGIGMFSVATFNYDEISKADRYILTLPINRKDIVLAKYVLIFLSTIIGAIFGIILSILLVYVTQAKIPDSLYLINLATGGIFGIGVAEAIHIPCIFKYGAEKGRIQRFIVFAIIAFLLGGVFYIVEKLNINLDFEMALSAKVLPLIFLFFTFVLYYISYKISYMIYNRKEL